MSRQNLLSNFRVQRVDAAPRTHQSSQPFNNRLPVLAVVAWILGIALGVFEIALDFNTASSASDDQESVP